MDPHELPPDDDGPALPVPHGAPWPGSTLLLGGPGGAHPLGPATVDSDADGVADTAVVPSVPGPGVLDLATDLDRDGDVDVLTSLSADGSARTVEVPDAVPPTDPAHDDPWHPGWDGRGDAVWEAGPGPPRTV